MFYKIIVIFIGATVLSFVLGDVSNKCAITDENCKAKMYYDEAKSLAKGIPDLGIPSLDPVRIEHLDCKLPESVLLTLVGGEMKGFASCTMKDFKSDLKMKITSLNATCNIEFDGQYKISVPKDATKSIGIGNAIDLEGTGKGNVRIESYQLSMDFHVHLIKKDGQVYTNVEKLKVSHTIMGKTTLIIEDVVLADKDTTEKVVTYINKNSELIQNTFAASALDKATHFYNNFVDKHVNVVPANYFLSGELDSFVNQ